MTIIIQYRRDILATVIKQQKEIKGIKTEREETKLSLLIFYIIKYVENPEESTKKKKTAWELLRVQSGSST